MRTHPAVQRRRGFKHGPHLVLVCPFFRCYLLQGCTQAHTSTHTHTYPKSTTQQCIAFQWHIHQSPTCSPIATLIHPTLYKPTPPLINPSASPPTHTLPHSYPPAHAHTSPPTASPLTFLPSRPHPPPSPPTHSVH